MGYASEEKARNTISSALSLGGTGAGIGFTVGGPPGAAIGGGIGLLVGGISGFFLTDDEKNEVIEAYRKGELDDETVARIEGTIARRYAILRREQGADFARRGVSKSSFAARQIGDIFNAERESLANALTTETQRRQAIGFGMSDAAAAERGAQVESGIGALFQGYDVYKQGEAMKTEAAADERLAAAIGKLYEGTPATRTPNATSFTSQTGAGNALSRHRSRMPNVKSPFAPSSEGSYFLQGSALEKRLKPSWMQ